MRASGFGRANDYSNGMITCASPFKCIVTSLLVTLAAAPAGAETLDEMFQALKEAGPQEAQRIEGRIAERWSDSGSAAIDLIFDRGAAALQEGDYKTAVEHFTAAIDHAPDFAEAYNGRATAYYMQDLYGPSLSDIRRVLQLNPRHFGAMRGFAVILEDLDRREDALETYKRVQAIHPHLADVASSIDRLERETGGQPT